jgi:hypothetical protein
MSTFRLFGVGRTVFTFLIALALICGVVTPPLAEACTRVVDLVDFESALTPNGFQ